MVLMPPEKAQFYGDSATIKLKELLDGSNGLMYVDSVSTDKYGRIIGKVFSGNIYVNNTMIKSGNAWWYQYYAPNDTDLSNSFEYAKSNKLGLWKYDNPINPYDYRKGKR